MKNNHGWKIKKLGEVAWFQEGPGVRNSQYTENGVKLLNVANLQEGTIDLNKSKRYISNEEAFGKYSHFLCDEGDLIIASSGIQVDYIEKKMGFVTKDMLPLCMNTSTIRFKILDRNSIKFLMYFFKSHEYKNQISRLITGSAQLNYGPSHLNKIKLPIPPLLTQLQIVSELDALSDIIAKKKLQLEELDRLAQATFYEMFGDPVTNEKGWVVKKLGKICDVGSSRRVFVNELVESGIPFYRGTEIGQLGAGKEINPELFITNEHYEELKKQCGVPQIGDLLMPSICQDGRIYRVNTNQPFYFKDGRVLWIKVDEKKINSIYLKSLLKEIFFTNYAIIASGSTFAELKIFALKDINLPLAAIVEQNKYALKYEFIETKKSLITQSIAEVQQLFDYTMDKYFN